MPDNWKTGEEAGKQKCPIGLIVATLGLNGLSRAAGFGLAEFAEGLQQLAAQDAPKCSPHCPM